MREGVLERGTAGTGSSGEAKDEDGLEDEVDGSEEADELERVVVGENVRARRTRSRSGILEA